MAGDDSGWSSSQRPPNRCVRYRTEIVAALAYPVIEHRSTRHFQGV